MHYLENDTWDRLFAELEGAFMRAATAPTLDLRTLLAFALAGAGVLAERDRDDGELAA